MIEFVFTFWCRESNLLYPIQAHEEYSVPESQAGSIAKTDG